jgi:hypothetical protein
LPSSITLHQQHRQECLCRRRVQISRMPSPEATRTVAGGPSEASDHRNTTRDGTSTPEGVAYQIPDCVNSLRDRCRGRKIGTSVNPAVSRFARDRRLLYEPPPVASCRFAAALQQSTLRDAG